MSSYGVYRIDCTGHGKQWQDSRLILFSVRSLCFVTVPMMREWGTDRRRESFEAQRPVIRG